MLGTHLDPRMRAARLAGILHLVGATTMLVTAPFIAIPDAPAFFVTVVYAVASAAVIMLLDWTRWRPWATVLPLVNGTLIIGLLIGAWAGVMDHYLLFYALCAVYAGLTQPPGTALKLAPFTFSTAALALAGAQTREHAVDILGAVVLYKVVGEVVGSAVAKQDSVHRDAQKLLHAVSSLHEERSETGAADLVAELAQTLLSPDVAITMVASQPGSSIYVNRGQRGLDDALGSLIVDSAGNSGVGLSMREDRAIFVADAQMSPLLARSVVARLGLASVLFVPVPGEGGYLGCVVVGWHTRQDALDDFGEQVVHLLSQQAGTLLERLRNEGRLQVQARTDALTGLGNRRAFLDALDRLRPGGAVLFVDLDHFKTVNDTLGHAAGDEVLRDFATALKRSVRDGDCIARYGGEEFAVVLPSAASVDMSAAAQVVVQRLRAAWQGPCTFSVGIATHRLGDAPSTTLARADQAVYTAKANGRNTLVLAAS
ncbi:MAG: sensor domain-containing diguanylate cyclase [Mycobacteriales bacterium]|nr:sensor domain-containing diguanylate cyclase [Mycobacteriales bacterium]